MDFTQTDMVAHHVRVGGDGGMGLKPSDYRTIPLSAYQHFHLHNMVEKKYYYDNGLDTELIMIDLMERYLRKRHAIEIYSREFEDLENMIEEARLL